MIKSSCTAHEKNSAKLRLSFEILNAVFHRTKICCSNLFIEMSKFDFVSSFWQTRKVWYLQQALQIFTFTVYSVISMCLNCFEDFFGKIMEFSDKNYFPYHGKFREKSAQKLQRKQMKMLSIVERIGLFCKPPFLVPRVKARLGWAL